MKRNMNILIFSLVLIMISAACEPFLTIDLPDKEPQIPAPTESPMNAAEELSEAAAQNKAGALIFPIADTGQQKCFDAKTAIDCPQPGEAFYGQDAQVISSQPWYQENGDGTVTDLVTGLMWQQDPGEKKTYPEAVSGAEVFDLAGYDDWRLPTIKELYSLIQFSGIDPGDPTVSDSTDLVPFIDDVFAFEYGDPGDGVRIIDSQFVSSTQYVSTTMGGNKTVFGVNFADGRIKGYGLWLRGGEKTFYVLYVRGNPDYGKNDFVDNGDGTVTDNASGLTWAQMDSGKGMNWEDALGYCENLELGGSSNWRLPNAKELQSIVDYGRSPDTTGTAAIDPIFNISMIVNEAEQPDFPSFWSSTTHENLHGGDAAAYVAFGRAMGFMNNQWMDVHGAGAQRSDPKSMSSEQSSPGSRGPQGDAVRVLNYVRCVRGGLPEE